MALAILFAMAFVLFFFSLLGTYAQTAESRPMQVEGLMLGFYPGLADGVRVQNSPGSKALEFNPGRRCLQNVTSERQGIAFQGISFDQEARHDVRDKLTGLIGYPGAFSGAGDDWLNFSHSLAAGYYRDNLAAEPPANVLQLLFVPMILAPKPVAVIKVEWTPDAKQILDTRGWNELENYCGTHFVAGLGEENYVIYSIRIHFADESQRVRVDRVRLDDNSQSPGLVLNNLFRMRQRLEFTGAENTVTLDILQVGGAADELAALQKEMGTLPVTLAKEDVQDSLVTRATMTCVPDRLQPCQALAQAFLDFQFRRLNFSGEKPSFTPVRFRIAPLRFVQALN